MKINQIKISEAAVNANIQYYESLLKAQLESIEETKKLLAIEIAKLSD